MQQVLEITTLRLVDDKVADDFVAANADINAYLVRQPGFRWRSIAVQPDGSLIDIVAYDSHHEAEAGASGIMTEMSGSPVHDVIEMSSVDWRIVRILQHVT